MLESRRLDTSFYDPEAIHALDQIQAYNHMQISHVGRVWCFGAYELCNNIQECDDPQATVFFKIGDLQEPFIKPENLTHITEGSAEILSEARVCPGDILVSIAGTIGACGLVPELEVNGYTANQALAKIRPLKINRYFLLSFMLTDQFKKVIKREAGGGVQKNLYLHNFSRLPIIKPCDEIQAYIGNKVRQAERLRQRAKNLKLDREELLETLCGLQLPESSLTSNVPLEALTARLDAKYNGSDVLALRDSLRNNSKEIGDLIKSKSNGFECRNFVDAGRRYITVSEVSSGRLNLSTAPQISFEVTVPGKAQLTEESLLVVRTGSLGHAVTPQPEDVGSAISSHLIHLKCKSRERANALGAFLSSPIGLRLQLAASYGAVQPQLSQDELLKIRVPNKIIENEGRLYDSSSLEERTRRSAEKLVSAAKFLVEALIEGQVTEAELIEAQNDSEKNRQILSKLTFKGYEVDGAEPLFPNIDELFQLLDETDNPSADEDA